MEQYKSKVLQRRTEEIFKDYNPITGRREDLLEPEIFEGELPRPLNFQDIKILKE